MEPKKTKKADVDRKRSTFLLIGLMVALGGVIVAFEYEEPEPEPVKLTSNLMLEMDEEMIDVTQQKEKPPPPPPPPKIEVVEDEVEIEEDQPEIEEVDIDQETEIEMPVIEEPVEEVVAEEVFTIVEEMPEFPGGVQRMYEWIGQKIQYPQMEKESGIQGTVVVTFVVEKDGSISDVRVLKGVSKGIDAEAVRRVEQMPNWKPGKQRGKSVRVQFNLPIRFTLQ